MENRGPSPLTGKDIKEFNPENLNTRQTKEGGMQLIQAKQSQFPQPLLTRLLLQTLHQLHCPSLDTLQHLNVPLVVGGPKLNTGFEKYLENYYGFKKSFIWKSNSPITQKIKEMQEFFGLKVMGKLDSDTLDLVQKCCCGFPDVAGFSTFAGQPKWAKQILTYRTASSRCQCSDQESVVWSSVTPLKFIKDRGDADIVISFAARGHNDFIPFDVPGGSIAHAYAPGKVFDGDAHFDEDETWTKSTEGTNLLYVAAREFGHSLGLLHAKDPNALMYPVYRKFDPSVLPLHQDDINGIQYLYDSAESKDPALPNTCGPNLTFDAVITFHGEIMFFKDKHFWHKHPAVRTADFNLVSSFWPRLPPGVDAAYEIPEKDETLIFKGNEFWVVGGETILPGYPKKSTPWAFQRTLPKLMLLFMVEMRRKHYFIADKFWSVTTGYGKIFEIMIKISQSVDRKSIPIRDAVPGINGKIDAVFQHE
ncbi:hypothetical protein QYF61_001002, partial [Mycteria americana]